VLEKLGVDIEGTRRELAEFKNLQAKRAQAAEHWACGLRSF